MNHEKKLNLAHVAIALNNLQKYGKTTVAKGDAFQSVGDALDRLEILYDFRIIEGNDDYMEMEIEKQ